jgi:hypothetical protein
MGVKRLESEGLERDLNEMRDSSASIRIDIDKHSGRLIEVALFLKGC